MIWGCIAHGLLISSLNLMMKSSICKFWEIIIIMFVFLCVSKKMSCPLGLTKLAQMFYPSWVSGQVYKTERHSVWFVKCHHLLCCLLCCGCLPSCSLGFTLKWDKFNNVQYLCLDQIHFVCDQGSYKKMKNKSPTFRKLSTQFFFFKIKRPKFKQLILIHVGLVNLNSSSVNLWSVMDLS